jgi:hypothetical protein
MDNAMSNLEKAEGIAEKLRHEPYRLLKNDCITKSVRLKKECQAAGIPARVVVCLGLARARWFGRWLTIPVVHGWCEVEGHRIETSRPLGSSGLWGIVPVNIEPVIALRF